MIRGATATGMVAGRHLAASSDDQNAFALAALARGAAGAVYADADADMTVRHPPGGVQEVRVRRPRGH